MLQEVTSRSIQQEIPWTGTDIVEPHRSGFVAIDIPEESQVREERQIGSFFSALVQGKQASCFRPKSMEEEQRIDVYQYSRKYDTYFQLAVNNDFVTLFLYYFLQESNRIYGGIPFY